MAEGSLLAFDLSPISIAPSNPDGKAVIYYYNPEVSVEYYATEDTISWYGCKYLIGMNDFLEALYSKKSDRSLALKYYHRTTDAKVEFPDKEYVTIPFFISHDGIVRHGDKFYRINKNKMEKSLEFLGCPENIHTNGAASSKILLKIKIHSPKIMNIFLLGAEEKEIMIDGDYFIRHNERSVIIDVCSASMINVRGNSIAMSKNNILINGNPNINSFYAVIKDQEILYDRYILLEICGDYSCKIEYEDFDIFPEGICNK
jgi:hypothetical protein